MSTNSTGHPSALGSFTLGSSVLGNSLYKSYKMMIYYNNAWHTMRPGVYSAQKGGFENYKAIIY